MRLIDADAMIMRLSDWALGASPNESDRGETRALRQREYDTIEHCVGVIVSSPTVDGWISVKDKLPEMHMTYRYDGDPPEEVPSGICKSKIVLVAVLCKESGEPEYFVGRGFLRDGEWWDCDGFYESPIHFEVTHWMPLPEPPEEVSVDD